MKNLEQIRAKHAANFWNPNFPNEQEGQRRLNEVSGENGGDVVRGLGSLIINNGLLATLAFSKEKNKGYKTFMEEIGKYLCTSGPDGRSLWNEPTSSLETFVNKLTASDSMVLQQATGEVLAYLSYLKRFRNH